MRTRLGELYSNRIGSLGVWKRRRGVWCGVPHDLPSFPGLEVHATSIMVNLKEGGGGGWARKMNRDDGVSLGAIGVLAGPRLDCKVSYFAWPAPVEGLA